MDASSGTNFYFVEQYSAPTPTPAPTPTATPTPTPSSTPTPPPPMPQPVTIYFGEYVWPAFDGTPLVGAAPYTVTAGTGCFTLVVTLPTAEDATKLRRTHVRPSQAGSDNASGAGDPQLPTPPPAVTPLDQGPLSSLAISNITPTSGSGTFSFHTSTQTVNGTITITGSETFTSGATRARFEWSRWQSLLHHVKAAQARRRR